MATLWDVSSDNGEDLGLKIALDFLLEVLLSIRGIGETSSKDVTAGEICCVLQGRCYTVGGCIVNYVAIILFEWLSDRNLRRSNSSNGNDVFFIGY